MISNIPGTQYTGDFPDSVWPGTQNWLVRRALETYYQAKTKGLGLAAWNSRINDNTKTLQAGAMKPSVWRIIDPSQVRVRTKVMQKYTMYNTGSTMLYATKIHSKARRHLRSGDGGLAVPSNSGYTETAMTFLTVADELSGRTPADTVCTKGWQPTSLAAGTPWLMPTPTGLDALGNDNLFTALRNWHARFQFMPWWHSKRNFQEFTFANAINDNLVQIGDGRATLGGSRATLGVVGTAQTWGTQQQAFGSYVPANGLGPVGNATDQAWLYQQAWTAFRNGPSGTQLSWQAIQDTTPPAAQASLNIEAFRMFPEYKEGRKGIMDRWWRRRTQRLPVLMPGQSRSFKVASSSTVRPWTMGIPGVSSKVSSYQEAANMWRGALINDPVGPTSPPIGMGMGFGLAFANGGGSPVGVMNQPVAQSQAIPHRWVYNRKTDPLGSPGTSGVTTLIMRGNTVPHLSGPGPAAPGDFVNCGPAQCMVKRETFWKVKMYVKGRKESNKPYLVQNDAYYDTDISQFQNFFRTSPAQSAPVTEAQI